LCPDFKVIRKDSKCITLLAAPVLHIINIITSCGSVVLRVKQPGKTVLLDEGQQRGTPPDGETRLLSDSQISSWVSGDAQAPSKVFQSKPNEHSLTN